MEEVSDADVVELDVMVGGSVGGGRVSPELVALLLENEESLAPFAVPVIAAISAVDIVAPPGLIVCWKGREWCPPRSPWNWGTALA
jgi:hypothetical protein